MTPASDTATKPAPLQTEIELAKQIDKCIAIMIAAVKVQPVTDKVTARIVFMQVTCGSQLRDLIQSISEHIQVEQDRNGFLVHGEGLALLKQLKLHQVSVDKQWFDVRVR